MKKAYILSKYIIDQLLNDSTFKVTAPLASKKIRFLELGSGCGLVGLSAWILGGYVVCSELSGEELEHTRSNIESNVKLILNQQQEQFNKSELRDEDIIVYPLNWYVKFTYK